MSLRKKIANLMVLTTALASFFGVFFCPQMSQAASLETGHHHQTDCGTAHNQSCAMNLDEHLLLWAHAFAAISTDALILFFVVLACVCLYTKSRTQTLGLPARYYNYIKEHPAPSIYNYLTVLFSSGILQPKIFA